MERKFQIGQNLFRIQDSKMSLSRHIVPASGLTDPREFDPRARGRAVDLETKDAARTIRHRPGVRSTLADANFLGAERVKSRKQQVVEEEISLDANIVLAMRPKKRVTWLTKAMQLGKDDRDACPEIYDVLSAEAFYEGMDVERTQKAIETMKKFRRVLSSRQHDSVMRSLEDNLDRLERKRKREEADKVEEEDSQSSKKKKSAKTELVEYRLTKFLILMLRGSLFNQVLMFFVQILHFYDEF